MNTCNFLDIHCKFVSWTATVILCGTRLHSVTVGGLGVVGLGVVGKMDVDVKEYCELIAEQPYS